MTPVIRRAARDDIIRQFRWYLVEQDAPDAAFGFMDAVEESVRQLSITPNIGAPREFGNTALKGIRIWPVKGFEDLLIFYLAQGEAVTVIRVLHGMRDLASILKRESANVDSED